MLLLCWYLDYSVHFVQRINGCVRTFTLKETEPNWFSYEFDLSTPKDKYEWFYTLDVDKALFNQPNENVTAFEITGDFYRFGIHPSVKGKLDDLIGINIKGEVLKSIDELSVSDFCPGLRSVWITRILEYLDFSLYPPQQ